MTAARELPQVPVGAVDTTHLAEAAHVAERLASRLRDLAAGETGWEAGALNCIDKLNGLRGDLERRHRAYLTEQINTAAGNAATHDWRLDEHRHIECARCDCSSTPYAVRYGQTPTCPDRCTAFNTRSGHGIYAVSDGNAYTAAGSSRCIYCDSVYPSTAAESERVR